jgi:6-phosphogluconolactonase
MIQAFNLSNTKKLLVPGTYEETIAFASLHFIECAKQSIARHGKFYVALSGGSTPKAIFNYLAVHFGSDSVWKDTFVFWGDERAVAPQSPESNYKTAMDSGFSRLPIPSSQIFRMHAEDELERHAIDYENLILENVPQGEFDLIMLGMGEDGHTASLFPLSKALTENKRLVVANFIAEKNTWRMTFTYPLLHKAHVVVFYVTGASKKTMLDKVLQDKNDLYPCAKVGTVNSPALWIVDKDAGELVLENLL